MYAALFYEQIRPAELKGASALLNCSTQSSLIKVEQEF
jgi:hypothetical protein